LSSNPSTALQPPPTKKKLWQVTRHWWLMPVILTTWEAKIGWENQSLRPAQANSSQDPISKITREKWTGGVAQAVEYLYCKHKALSSNPSLN
jgi:hypothetical protein